MGFCSRAVCSRHCWARADLCQAGANSCACTRTHACTQTRKRTRTNARTYTHNTHTREHALKHPADALYSQTSLIRSSFIRIPRHPEENSWLQIYSIRNASYITGVRLSGSLAYPDIFCGKRMCAVKRGLTVLASLCIVPISTQAGNTTLQFPSNCQRADHPRTAHGWTNYNLHNNHNSHQHHQQQRHQCYR